MKIFTFLIIFAYSLFGMLALQLQKFFLQKFISSHSIKLGNLPFYKFILIQIDMGKIKQL